MRNRRRSSIDHLAGGKDFMNFRRHIAMLKSTNQFHKLREFYLWFKHAITYEINPHTMKQTGNIIAYNETYAIFFGAFIPRRGWIFSPLELLALLTVSIGLTFLLGSLSCINSKDPNETRCISLPAPNTSYLTLLTLCSFILSIFVNSTVQRWWTLRTFFSSLQGECIDCMMLYVHILTRAASFHEDLPDYQIMKDNCMRNLKRMAGLLNLLYSLACSSNGGDKGFNTLYERGVLSLQDYKYFESIDAVPSDVCSAIMQCAYGLTSSKLIRSSDYIVAEMMKVNKIVSMMRADTTNISVYINVQLPFPFIQVVSSVVLFFILQLFVVSSSFVAVGLSTNNHSYLAIGLSTIIMYNFVLFGFLRLYTILCDPCGDDAADFPLKTYALSLEAHLQEMCEHAFVVHDLLSFDSQDVSYGGQSQKNKDIANLKRIVFEKFGNELTF